MKYSDLSLEQKKKLHVSLSWWLLEQKLFYYHPEHGKCVDDSIYDKKEVLYNRLCDDLGLEKSASSCVGFPSDTPSGRLIMSKYPVKNDEININVVNKRPSRNDTIRGEQIRTRPPVSIENQVRRGRLR